MALSERDLKVLHEMERGLQGSDPRWTSRMSRRQARLGRLYLAFAMFLVGVSTLIGGAMLAGGFLVAGVLVSVAGFIVMLGAGWQLCFGRTRIAATKRALPVRSTTT